MYVALFPCNECAKVIIQSGIKEVVYMSDKYAEHNSMKASRKMMTLAKVCSFLQQSFILSSHEFLIDSPTTIRTNFTVCQHRFFRH